MSFESHDEYLGLVYDQIVVLRFLGQTFSARVESVWGEMDAELNLVRLARFGLLSMSSEQAVEAGWKPGPWRRWDIGNQERMNEEGWFFFAGDPEPQARSRFRSAAGPSVVIRLTGRPRPELTMLASNEMEYLLWCTNSEVSARDAAESPEPTR